MTRFQTTALPYIYRGDGLELYVEECVVDGERTINVNSESGVVSLAEFNDWEEATLSARVEVPEDVIEDVFPPDERRKPPGRIYVTVRSIDTIFRGRVDLAHEPIHSGTYEETIPLPKSEIRRKVELQPYLVRADDTSGVNPRFGTTKGVRLASGLTWEVEVDSADELGDQMIDGEKAKFGERDDLPSGDHLYYLDFRNAERPKLWLNSEHQRIVDILHSSGSVGARARMRDVILNQIQSSVWTQLIVKTATHISEETFEPRHEWQETIIDIFGEDLSGSDNPRDVGQYLHKNITSSENIPYLMEDIDDAVQSHVEHREQLINLVEEARIL